jgi:uncharacterized iron-regulated membrane protein
MKIRSDILLTYKSLHTWTGICAGLFLFIAFFAGALTMFQQPIDSWLSPPQQQLNKITDEVQLDAVVENVIAQHPSSHAELTVHLTDMENIAAPVTWTGKGRRHEIELDEKLWIASVDSQGEFIAKTIEPSILAELIDMLHRTGGIPFTADGEYLGIYLMGFAAILYFLAIVSGFILLLPTLVKGFFAVRKGKNLKRFWLDTHNVVGIASLPFHIIISFTAIVFAFHDQIYDGLHEVVYGQEPMFGTRPAKMAEPYQPKNVLLPSQVIAIAKEKAPEFEINELVYMGLESSRPVIRVGIFNPDYVLRGPITGYMGIHPYTGKITNTDNVPGKSDVWGSIVSTLFALHFGSFGGDLVRWLYFILGIGGAFLFYSGNLLWVESRRKKQRRGQGDVSQARNTRWMAAMTVGVCLGSMTGVALAMTVGKWAYSLQVGVNLASVWVYYLFFLGAVVFALIRGAALASAPLLYLCAMACFSIPLTTFLGGFMLDLVWAHTSLATLSVDAVALLLSICFMSLAKRNTRRLEHGIKDSVWSAE